MVSGWDVPRKQPRLMRILQYVGECKSIIVSEASFLRESTVTFSLYILVVRSGPGATPGKSAIKNNGVNVQI